MLIFATLKRLQVIPIAIENEEICDCVKISKTLQYEHDDIRNLVYFCILYDSDADGFVVLCFAK